jgi:interleukin-1 receptor-associated kinase 1
MYSALSPGDYQTAALLAMSEGGNPGAMPVALSPLLPPPQLVVVALDATRDHREVEVRMALRALVARGDILRGGDSLVVLGVLHAITNPSEGQAPPLGLSFPCGLRSLALMLNLTHSCLKLPKM